MILEEWRTKDILDGLEILDVTQNESTRTHKVVGVLLGHIAKQDRTYNFVSQNYENGLITDFEVTKKDTDDEVKLIHVVEAKASMALGQSEPQLRSYLIDRNCSLGCLTDGYMWQFYRLKSSKLEPVGEPVYTRHDLDTIVSRITAGY